MQTVTLIIDKRREISVKYKKLLQDEYSQVILSKDIISAMKFIQDKEPDLIIISDSMGQDLARYCSEIRAITYNMRPIIVATSKSSDVNDRLNVLENGADDFISEPINSKEFVMRIKAHIRREFESNLDDRKLLPNRKYTMRALKRITTSDKQWAAMLISIDNFKNYKDAYTKLASDKLIQTYSAIIASTLSSEDFLGALTDNKFVVITDELKAEKAANFLIFAFDAVAEKFYSATDIERGFVITDGDSLAGRRDEFVHTTIGIVTNNSGKFNDANELLSKMTNIHNLAKLPKQSNYLVERTQIPAENAIAKKIYNNKVLIIEEDDATILLLKTILEIQGYEIFSVHKFSELTEDFVPAVVILDAGSNEERSGLDVCRLIKDAPLYQHSKLIVTSVFHEKETVLKTGADLYIPKPYDVSTLVKWVNTFVKEVNI